jgi:hypothetical protein
LNGFSLEFAWVKTRTRMVTGKKKLVLSVEFVNVHSRSNFENWKMKGLSLKR